MKKIFTMLLGVFATVGIVSAQSGGFGHSKQGSAYAQNTKHDGTQNFKRGYNTDFAPHQMNHRYTAVEKSKQYSSVNNCDEQVRHDFNRFEKRHQQHAKSFVKSNAHRW